MSLRPGDRGHAGAQAERVAQPDAERAEPVPAPHVRAHRVVHLLPVAATQPRHDEPRPVTEGVVELLLGHQQGAGRAAGVLDAEGDQRLLVDLDAPGHGGALEREPQVVPAHQQPTEQGECHEQHADAGQVGEARARSRTAPT